MSGTVKRMLKDNSSAWRILGTIWCAVFELMDLMRELKSKEKGRGFYIHLGKRCHTHRMPEDDQGWCNATPGRYIGRCYLGGV